MKKAGIKRTTRHKILFDDEVSSLCVAAAKICGSNLRIKVKVRKETGVTLTDNEITYRLAKAQKLEGRKGGYRVGFSNGTSPESQRIERDYLAIFQREIQRTLPQKITHPTPQVVRVKEPAPPTVPQLTETLEQRNARLGALKASYEKEMRNEMP